MKRTYKLERKLRNKPKQIFPSILFDQFEIGYPKKSLICISESVSMLKKGYLRLRVNF